MPDRPMHNERDGGWFQILDDLEGEILGVCDGSISLNEIVSEYLDDTDEGEEIDAEYQENIFGNVLRRLVRLYEHTLISW